MRQQERSHFTHGVLPCILETDGTSEKWGCRNIFDELKHVIFPLSNSIPKNNNFYSVYMINVKRGQRKILKIRYVFHLCLFLYTSTESMGQSFLVCPARQNGEEYQRILSDWLTEKKSLDSVKKVQLFCSLRLPAQPYLQKHHNPRVMHKLLLILRGDAHH